MPNETELRRVVVEPKVPASAHTKGEYTGDEVRVSVALWRLALWRMHAS